MKIIKRIKQISTGQEFEIYYCNFYSDVVHFHDNDYGIEKFIPNNDWEFVEQESFEMTFEEAQALEKENSIKRNVVICKSWELFPSITHNKIIHNFKGINLNNHNIVDILYEKNIQAGVETTIDEIEIFISCYKKRILERLNYVETEIEKQNIKPLYI